MAVLGASPDSYRRATGPLPRSTGRQQSGLSAPGARAPAPGLAGAPARGAPLTGPGLTRSPQAWLSDSVPVRPRRKSTGGLSRVRVSVSAVAGQPADLGAASCRRPARSPSARARLSLSLAGLVYAIGSRIQILQTFLSRVSGLPGPGARRLPGPRSARLMLIGKWNKGIRVYSLNH